MSPNVTCLQYQALNMQWFVCLVDGHYVQCFVRVSPGEKVLTMEETPEGYGKEEKFVTLKQDFDSFQSAPKFLDDAKVNRPSKICTCISMLILFLF